MSMIFLLCRITRIGTDTLDVLVGLELWCLMHFSTIFQLYRGGEFY
jgi:hypothetical protein